MRALVTGAAGFVGRYMMVELSLNGYDVVGIDIADSIDPGSLEQILSWLEPGSDADIDSLPIEYKKCSVLDEKFLSSVIEDTEPDSIVHLAAQSSAGRSFKDPRETVEVNFLGSLNLFETARAYVGPTGGGGVTILSVGSSEEYGIRSEDEMPLVESAPLDPASPYAVSKAAQEMLARQYSRTFRLKIVSTRSFNHTGPMQSDRFVLPSFARQCAMIKAGLMEPVITVGNVDVVRDFTDVRDTVRAYRLLLERGGSGEVYNVCSGSGVKLAEALDILVRMAGIEISVNVDNELLRPSDIPVLIGSNEKLKREVSWERRFSTEDMLSDLLNYWVKEVKNLAN